MTEVVPAIIPKSFDDLKEKLARVQGHVSGVQIDIMDGKYAPEPSWPFSLSGDGDAAELRDNLSQKMRIGFELDMMVLEPEKYVEKWAFFGIHTFLIHFESTDRLDEIIEKVRGMGKGVAIALKPSTNVNDIEPYIKRVDFVQFMGNDKIGFHGVSLDEKVLHAIRDLRNKHKELIISIDIGVNFETAPKLVEAGVSKLVSGSTIFNAENIKDAIQKLSIS